MNSPASPLVIGQYELHGAMSSGGMATVYFGRLVGPVGFSRTVAIKRLHPQFARDPSFVSMFVDEARLVSRISHPNVVPTVDVVSTDGELFLVMEYVHGESLSKLLATVREKKARISPHIVSTVMSGVLRGLHAAHEASHPKTGPLNIVHRDISPQNVLVGVDGLSRVLDFGVAKALDRVQDQTREGQLKGKLAYMAPEQFHGVPVTRSVDIFAASIVLWEALTARRLFAADRQVDTVRKILDVEAKAPSQIIRDADLESTVASDTHHLLEALDRVVLRGLEKDPAKRFPTAREMAQALEQAMPPASPSEVTEWVEHYARDALVARANELDHLTTSLSRTMAAPVAYAEIASTSGQAPAGSPQQPLRQGGSQVGMQAQRLYPPPAQQQPYPLPPQRPQPQLQSQLYPPPQQQEQATQIYPPSQSSQPLVQPQQLQPQQQPSWKPPQAMSAEARARGARTFQVGEQRPDIDDRGLSTPVVVFIAIALAVIVVSGALMAYVFFGRH